MGQKRGGNDITHIILIKTKTSKINRILRADGITNQQTAPSPVERLRAQLTVYNFGKLWMYEIGYCAECMLPLYQICGIELVGLLVLRIIWVVTAVDSTMNADAPARSFRNLR